MNLREPLIEIGVGSSNCFACGAASTTITAVWTPDAERNGNLAETIPVRADMVEVVDKMGCSTRASKRSKETFTFR